MILIWSLYVLIYLVTLLCVYWTPKFLIQFRFFNRAWLRCLSAHHSQCPEQGEFEFFSHNPMVSVVLREFEIIVFRKMPTSPVYKFNRNKFLLENLLSDFVFALLLLSHEDQDKSASVRNFMFV